MKRIIAILVLAVLGWYAWGKYEAHVRAERAAEAASKSGRKLPPAAAQDGGQDVTFFTCDGRTQCKQLTSCEEARYFVKNCPGFNAGVMGEDAPCEQQWCKK